MDEIWKDIAGFEGYYEVSNMGNIRRKELYIEDKNGVIKHYEQKDMKVNVYIPNTSNIPRVKISLMKNGKVHTFMVHRLVALAFIPNPNNYPQINHKDENPLNNNVNNLEWCTAEYNHNYGTRNYRHKEKLKKKINVYDLNHKYITQYNSMKEAAQSLNLDASGITKVCKHKNKYCGQYIFEYA